MFTKILQKISNFFLTSLTIFLLFILFLNNLFWHSQAIGIFFSIFYFLSFGGLLAQLFGGFTGGSKKFKHLIGIFLAFYLLAFGLAVPIVFFNISAIYFYLFLFLLTLVVSFLASTTKYPATAEPCLGGGEMITKIRNEDQEANNMPVLPISPIFCILFFIFYIIGWVLILSARTGDYVVSPWVVISKYYQVVWFVLAFLLVILIFSKLSAKKILFLLILTSLLFHAYLPFVSENSFGVDRWRHVGAERRLIEGQIEPPALIGDVSYVKIGPISIPRVFMMPNKFSYSNQWGMTIGLSWLTQIDILKIDQYLIWFLWSIFFTIFIYKLAQLIFNKEKLSLLITFVALFCFFTLQVGGAITVPHAIGFLPFLFFLLIFFSYLKNQNKNFWPIIIFSLVLLIFNYILYLILALEILILSLVLKGEGRVKKIILPILIILFILSLPLLDRLSGTSFFVYEPLEALKKLPQKLIEYDDPISYFFYQSNSLSFLPGLINKIRWQVFFPLLVIVLTILGLAKNFKNNRLAKILAVFLFIFATNQFISFSFMKDYRLLSLRLGNVLMLFLIFFFTAGLYWLIEFIGVKYYDRNKQHPWQNIKLMIVIAAIFLAGLSLTTYASGPAYGNVTNTDLLVAKYLNSEMINSGFCSIKPVENNDCQNNNAVLKNYCVFDASWRLLALESVNGMIAGNFPTDSVDFVQKEKDELYRQMLDSPSPEILTQTLKITNTKKCFFVANSEWLKSEIFDKIKNLLGEPKIINNVYIWSYKE